MSVVHLMFFFFSFFFFYPHLLGTVTNTTCLWLLLLQPLLLQHVHINRATPAQALNPVIPVPVTHTVSWMARLNCGLERRQQWPESHRLQGELDLQVV